MKLYRITLDKSGSICQGTYSVEGFEKVSDMLQAIAEVLKVLDGKVKRMQLHTENGEIVIDHFAEAVKLLESFGKTDSIGEDSLFVSGIYGDERIVIEFPLKVNKFLSVSAKGRRIVMLVERELYEVFEK